MIEKNQLKECKMNRREATQFDDDFKRYKTELNEAYLKQFETEKLKLKNDYDDLMREIERNRDNAEEERMKSLIRKMAAECELALKRQWEDAEELRWRTIEELKDLIRKEIRIEMEAELRQAIEDALHKAEQQFKIREQESIDRTRKLCEDEAEIRFKKLANEYDSSIDILLLK
jgi:uncharacterized protein (DUF2267 family)